MLGLLVPMRETLGLTLSHMPSVDLTASICVKCKDYCSVDFIASMYVTDFNA